MFNSSAFCVFDRRELPILCLGIAKSLFRGIEVKRLERQRTTLFTIDNSYTLFESADFFMLYLEWHLIRSVNWSSWVI